MPDFLSPWCKLPLPLWRNIDEFRHIISDSRYCVYNWYELTIGVGIFLNQFY